MIEHILKKYEINGAILAKLTGQSTVAVARKVRNQKGQKIGPGEAGIIACWSTMSDAQKELALTEFESLMRNLSDESH